MAFLRSIPPANSTAVIRGDRVVLKTPSPGDYQQWATLRSESRGFLAPWEPIWPADELSRVAFRRRIRRYQREIREGTGYPFFVFAADGDTLLGGLTLSQVQRGVTQSCSLGYWMGAPYAGHGFMSSSVRAVIRFAFGTLHLHRIEAACLPHNGASIRLLEKVGFTREGYARRFLCIDGRWQDHLLFGLVSDDPVG